MTTWDPKYGYDPARDHLPPSDQDYTDIIRMMQTAQPYRPLSTRESPNLEMPPPLNPLHQRILEFLTSRGVPVDFGYPESMAPYSDPRAPRDFPSSMIPQPTSRLDFGKNLPVDLMGRFNWGQGLKP